MAERALVVSKTWAGIFSALFVSLLIATASYSWTANAQIAVLRSDVDDLKKAELSIRLARIEGKLDQIVSAISNKK